MHDWVRGDHFYLTRDFLALMLGVRRASITHVARTLQELRLITYQRGNIFVVDRAGLEEVACEDYAAIRHAVECLLALPPSFASTARSNPRRIISSSS